jgi:hypothetical protein
VIGCSDFAEQAAGFQPPVCLCARQGALTSWLKSNAGPARGTASRTARVSIARWNLKEAVSKTLVRRTASTYEAAAADERAKRLKVQHLHGSCGSKCDGPKRGSQCALPGEISGGAIKLARSQGWDEAAGEVSRGHSRRALCAEGPNRKTGTEALVLDERDSARKDD